MEVHHHSHHGKKKWTEYFWEFLMLFLAVFAGFLAENQREHMVEHQREKQYIKSLLADLIADTASIGFNEKLYDTKVKYLDSLLTIRYRDFSIIGNRELFYYYILNGIYGNSYFQNHDATLIQLRNSGGLRLIRAKGAADSIAAYQSLFDQTMAQREAMDRYWVKTSSLMEKIIDQTIVFDTIYFNGTWFTGKSELPISKDKQLLKEFFNAVQMYRAICYFYNSYYLKRDEDYIQALKKFLGKTYHIKS